MVLSYAILSLYLERKAGEIVLETRKERKRQLVRNAILSAAASLFESKGYDESSVDDIASKADVAKRTLYTFFESKEQIVMELRMASFQNLACSAFENAEKGKPAIKEIENFLVSAVEWSSEHESLSRVLFLKGPPLPPPRMNAEGGVLPPLPSFFTYLRKLVLLAQNSGELRSDIDAEFMTHSIGFVLMYTNFALLSPPQDGKKKLPLQRMARDAWYSLLNGFGTKAE